jgi:RecA-family ATPase
MIDRSNIPLPAGMTAFNPKTKKTPGIFNVFDNLITEKDHYGEPVPIINIRNAPFALMGDISFISGQSKSGKSHVLTNMIVAAMKPPGNDADTLMITAKPAGNKKVIYVDTEQHASKTQKALKGVLRKLNLKHSPPNLLFSNIRHFARQERLDCLKNAIAATKKNEVHFWILDGIADFLTSVNAEEEANELVSYLMSRASELDTTFILNLHENPSGGKLRGHIGSEAERKCGGMITVKKDREKKLHFIESKLLRESEDFEPVAFSWNNEEHGFVTLPDTEFERIKKVDSSSKEEQKRFKKIEEFEQMFDVFFSPIAKMEKSELIEKIWKYKKATNKRTGERGVKEATELGIIKELETGLFVRIDLKKGFLLE